MRFATQTAALGMILALIAPAIGAAEDAGGETAPVVTVVDEQVTISARESPVSELLAEIGRQAGFEVRGRVANPQTVTIEFKDVPIRVAVRRLIGEQSFTMRYGADEELRCITLRSAAPETPQVVARSENFQTMLRAYPKVRVSGVLAKQFGKNEVPLTRILRVVRIQPAGPLRTEAMTRFLGIVEGDRNLRRGLRDMTSAQLLLFLRKEGGRNAGDLARFLAAEAHDANVRQRALRAVRSLPKRG